MAQSGGPSVRGLYRYPVKGLSPEPLERVELRAGETVPFDRAYAIENGPGRFDPDHPQHLPKIHFLMLMRDERLATLQTKFDDASETLTILRDGKQVARGQLTTPLGRQMIEQFLAAYMEAELRGAPKIVFSQGYSFSDVAAKCVHIVNLASVRELERAAGNPVNPLRFRPNIVIDGAAPWQEFSWIDNEIAVGGAKLAVLERTSRCAATNVDPDTGKRDMAIPAVLQRTWGHTDFGVYARVSEDGTIAISDAITV
ncbi:MAG: MOSC domain-containing protein [Hyphomicrobium sp.]